jgi:spermidine synthase
MSPSPKLIFSINSNINGFLKVVDTSSGRELRSNKDIVISLSENHKYFRERYWGIYIEELRKLRNTYKRALCLGLGGGSIQNQLSKIYPGIEMLSIEIDPLMNDIYNYYFLGNKTVNHKILNMDALIFLKNHSRFGAYEGYFDLIFVDIVSSMGLNEFEKVKNFYKLSKKLLKKDGIFSMNLIIKDNAQYEESVKILDLLKEEFIDIKLVYTGDTLGKANLEVFASDKITL